MSARPRLEEIEIWEGLPEISRLEPDLDVRARSVLRLLMCERHASVGPAMEEANPKKCPNCGGPCENPSSPYCSDCCREQAAFVRQMRESLANGSLADEHRQTMKGEVLWRLLGGGLPRRLALVPEKARERVFRREEGKCELCGAPATTIDNTGSG